MVCGVGFRIGFLIDGCLAFLFRGSVGRVWLGHVFCGCFIDRFAQTCMCVGVVFVGSLSHLFSQLTAAVLSVPWLG